MKTHDTLESTQISTMASAEKQQKSPPQIEISAFDETVQDCQHQYDFSHVEKSAQNVYLLKHKIDPRLDIEVQFVEYDEEDAEYEGLPLELSVLMKQTFREEDIRKCPEKVLNMLV